MTRSKRHVNVGLAEYTHRNVLVVFQVHMQLVFLHLCYLDYHILEGSSVKKCTPLTYWNKNMSYIYNIVYLQLDIQNFSYSTTSRKKSVVDLGRCKPRSALTGTFSTIPSWWIAPRWGSDTNRYQKTCNGRDYCIQMYGKYSNTVYIDLIFFQIKAVYFSSDSWAA